MILAQTNYYFYTYLHVCWGLRTVSPHLGPSVHVILWQKQTANYLSLERWECVHAALLICIYLRKSAQHSCRAALTVIYPAVINEGFTTGSGASYRSRAAAVQSCSPSSRVFFSASQSRSACGISRGAETHICHRLVWRFQSLPLWPEPPWLRTTGFGRECTPPCYLWRENEMMLGKLMLLENTRERS